MTHHDPHSHSAEAGDDAQSIPAQDARQGRKGRRLLIVLVVSVTAAALLLLGWWAINNNSLKQTADAASAAPTAVEVVPADRSMPASPDTAPPPAPTDRP